MATVLTEGSFWRVMVFDALSAFFPKATVLKLSMSTHQTRQRRGLARRMGPSSLHCFNALPNEPIPKVRSCSAGRL